MLHVPKHASGIIIKTRHFVNDKSYFLDRNLDSALQFVGLGQLDVPDSQRAWPDAWNDLMAGTVFYHVI